MGMCMGMGMGLAMSRGRGLSTLGNNALIFSQDTGIYSPNVSVEIISNIGLDIYYTLDGSDPTISSSLYSVPILVESTIIIKAIGHRQGYYPTDTETRVYTIAEYTEQGLSWSAADSMIWDSSDAFTFGRIAN